MEARMQSQIGQLYRQYRQTDERSEQRKLFAAMGECLSAWLAAQERALRAAQTLSLLRFREHYVAARTFRELCKLEVGSSVFDATLAALCVRLGALGPVQSEPDVLRAA